MHSLLIIHWESLVEMYRYNICQFCPLPGTVQTKVDGLLWILTQESVSEPHLWTLAALEYSPGH